VSKPFVGWDRKLRHWLQAVKDRGSAPPPHHWMTSDRRLRCAVCGDVLTDGELEDHVRRTAPRCAVHAPLIPPIEKEFS